jgi:hypothetical protein
MTVSLDIIAFAEKFGASTVSLEDEVAQAMEMQRDAERLFVEHSYEESDSILDQVDIMLVDVQTAAMVLKDQALFWVYAIEWLSVTAVSIISLFALWTVMIKRRLYREVSITKAQLS